MMRLHRNGSGPDRRSILGAGGVLLAAGGLLSIGLGLRGARSQQVIKDIRDLKPGEFTWHPDRSPAGPVAVVASIPEQKVHVYRNGIRIGLSTCSTGKPGHGTPTGVFVVLQKDRNHRSSTYNNAPMPNMNRLTWDGIALHAGKLPGYPASHGCVRLPREFSAKLFSVTHIGTPVIISGSSMDPWELIHPGLVLGERSEAVMEAAVVKLKDKMHPSDWTDGTVQPITAIIASGADRTVTLIENGRIVGSAALEVSGNPRLGEHVFTLRGATSSTDGLAWQGISHHADPAQPLAPEEALLARLKAAPDFLRLIHDHTHPGMILVVTDLPSKPETRSGTDFVLMTDGDA